MSLLNYYRVVEGLTPEIEQEIVGLHKRAWTLNDIEYKYKKIKLPKQVIGQLLLQNNCKIGYRKIENAVVEHYAKLHPCELFDYIPHRHGYEIKAYNLGDEISWITLCRACAKILKLDSDKVPDWYPQTITNETNLRLQLFNYVESTFDNHNDCEFFDISRNHGSFYSDKNQKNIRYDSLLELKHMREMEKDDEIISYSRGPRLKFMYKRQYTTYNPDFKVRYKNGDIKIVECKPKVFLKVGLRSRFETVYKLPAQIEAAELYCRQHNYTFEFWTD